MSKQVSDGQLKDLRSEPEINLQIILNLRFEPDEFCKKNVYKKNGCDFQRFTGKNSGATFCIEVSSLIISTFIEHLSTYKIEKLQRYQNL